jgi:hypothetical protein
MSQIRGSIEDEMATLLIHEEEENIDIEALIQESMKQHEGNISFIDDKLANRNRELNRP